MINTKLYENIGDNSSKDIFEAAMRNDCQYVIKYYKLNGDINITDERKETLLHKASRNNNYEIVDLLIKLGVSVDALNISGDSPLHLAVKFKNDEVALKLILEGANVNIQNKKMVAPLHLASTNSNLNILNILINHGARINIVDENGLQPIHYAVKSGDKTIIRTLLDCGSSLVATDNRKNNVLHFACEAGSDEIVIYILRHLTITDFKNIYGQTPLHLASLNCTIKSIKALIDAGYHLDIKDNNGDTPYDLAYRNEKQENANFILEYLNSSEYREKFAKYVFHSAVYNNDYQYVLENINHVNANEVDYYGRSLMYYALVNENIKIVQHLYKMYARIKNVDGFNQSALLIAVYTGNIEIVKFLLEKGANPNEIYYNRSYLYRAILQNNVELVKVLINYNADISYVDNKHRTIYSYALEYATDEIIELLLNKFENK